MTTTDSTATIFQASVLRAAEGFDLADEQDRALYRGALRDGLVATRVDWIRENARAFGAESVPTSRAGAIRALADAALRFGGWL